MTGAEGGKVIADEQHDGGARITLERDCLRAPYAITCTVYGWAYHTRFLADEADREAGVRRHEAGAGGDRRAAAAGATATRRPTPSRWSRRSADFAERFP